MKFRSLISFAIFAVAALVAFMHPAGIIGAAAVLFVLGNGIAPMGSQLRVTLTSTEILQDVIGAFKKAFPMLARMSYEFTSQLLKLGQTYIAHIASVPSAEDVTTTYAVTGQTAKSLLTDVSVLVNTRKGVLLKWTHLARLQDTKEKYDECIANAGYALAKALVDDLLTAVRSRNFSYGGTYAAADFDVDALVAITGALNTQGAANMGRTLIINSDAANYLSLDSRMGSRDYQGQLPAGEGYRRWVNAWGFAEIIEYPDLSTNNGTALTSVSITASTDVAAKTGHGLLTGDRILYGAGSGGSGLTDATYYYAIKVDADSFKFATTRANAIAGTAVNVSTDATGVTVTKKENVIAFAFERRAITFLAGVPDGFSNQGLQNQLSIPANMNFETVSFEGITMGAASWQDVGTGDLNWEPTLTWGWTAGASAAAANQGTDQAGYIIRSA